MASSTPLEFGGQEQFTADPARLFHVLTDLENLAQTIPDVVSSERVDQHTLRAVVRPGFSFLRGTLKLTMTLADLHEPQSATMQVAAQGIGASMRVESHLAIAAEGTGSRLNWNARVAELTGLLATISSKLVQAAAEQVIQNTWLAIRQRLGE